jgi:anaerobic magnesium-protoporphyrin IX monomethyl ester cyclase
VDAQRHGAFNNLEKPVDLFLIFPPQWSPFQPFLSTPSLKAYLEGKGYRVRQADWNAAFYEFFVSQNRLPVARDRLEHYARELSDDYATYRGRAVHSLVTLEDYDNLRRDLSALRNPMTWKQLAGVKAGVDALHKLLDAFSAAESVVEVGSSTLFHPGVLNSLQSLKTFVSNNDDNPFAPYFHAQLDAMTILPRFFGVSIIGAEQIVPGLTLCRMLKTRFPEIPVVIGGSVFSRLIEKPQWIEGLMGEYFDYICRFEGERPMEELLGSDSPQSDSLPNMAFRRDGQLAVGEICEPLHLDTIPTPDFDDLDFRSYLTPEVVLPLLASRGCYWGKCAFRYHGMIYQDRYRLRSPEQITEDVLNLNKKYDVRHFAFNDEAIPPKLFKLLPKDNASQ